MTVKNYNILPYLIITIVLVLPLCVESAILNPQGLVRNSELCPNRCSGHGWCDFIESVCHCDDGWNGGAADCSMRSCPLGRAWADKASGLDTAHAYAECSNNGICDRSSGTCKCFSGFSGSSCQRSTCGPSDCGDHGKCTTIDEMHRLYGPSLSQSKSLGVPQDIFQRYANWEANSTTGCVCDMGRFGADCSLIMCPKGNDPLQAAYVTGVGRTIHISAATPVMPTELTGLGFRFSFNGFSFYISPHKMATRSWNSSHCAAAFSSLPNIEKATCSDVIYDVAKASNGWQWTLTTTATLISYPMMPVENNIFTNNGLANQGVLGCDTALLHGVNNSLTIHTGAPFLNATCTISDTTDTTLKLPEYTMCSNRGLCNFFTGSCYCLEGFTNPNCDTYRTSLYPTLTPPNSDVLTIESTSSSYTNNLLSITANTWDDQPLIYVPDYPIPTARKLLYMNCSSPVTLSGVTIDDNGNLVPITTNKLHATSFSIDQAGNTQTRASWVAGNGLNILQSGGLQVYKGGITVNSGDLLLTDTATLVGPGPLGIGSGGATIRGPISITDSGARLSGGLYIANGGIKVQTGAAVNSGGMRVVVGGLRVSAGGLSVGGGGLYVWKKGFTIRNGGVNVNGGGVVVSRVGINIQDGGLSIGSDGFLADKMTIQDAVGLTILTGGMTISTGGMNIYSSKINSGGFTAAAYNTDDVKLSNVNSKGIVATGGATVSSGNIIVSSGGIVATGGLSINSGGALSYGGMTVSSGGMNAISGQMNLFDTGMTISSGGANVVGGISIQSGGLTVTNSGLSISQGGLTINAGGQLITANGITISAGGMSITNGGITINANGLKTNAGGMTVQAGGFGVTDGGMTVGGTSGLRINNGGVTMSGGLSMTGGLSVKANRLVVQAGGLNMNSNGGIVRNGGVVVSADGMKVTAGGLTIDNALIVGGGLTVGGGGLKSTTVGDLSITSGGLVVTGGLTLTVDTKSYSPTGNAWITAGGLTVSSSGLWVNGYPFGTAMVVTGGISIITGGMTVEKGGLMVSGASGIVTINDVGLQVSLGGLSILGGGLGVNGGATVNTGGASVVGGGRVSGGVGVSAGGLSVTRGNFLISAGGLTIESGSMALVNAGFTGGGGVNVGGGGLTITSSAASLGILTAGSVTIQNSGIRVTGGGVKVVLGGVLVDNTATSSVSSGKVYVNSGGLNAQQDGCTISNGGLTISSGGFSITDGVTINTGGLYAAAGLTSSDNSPSSSGVVSGGLQVSASGLRVGSGFNVIGDSTATGDITIAQGGLNMDHANTNTVTSISIDGTDQQGLSINAGGLVVSGLTVYPFINYIYDSGLLITGGLSVYGETQLDEGNHAAMNPPLRIGSPTTAAQGTKTTSSDRRLKTNITPIQDSLSLVKKLRGVYFQWHPEAQALMRFDDNRHIGLMAQDVLDVLPECVTVYKVRKEENKMSLGLGVGGGGQGGGIRGKGSVVDEVNQPQSQQQQQKHAHLNQGLQSDKEHEEEEKGGGGVMSGEVDSYLGVMYSDIVPVLIEAIRELNDNFKAVNATMMLLTTSTTTASTTTTSSTTTKRSNMPSSKSTKSTPLTSLSSSTPLSFSSDNTITSTGAVREGVVSTTMNPLQHHSPVQRTTETKPVLGLGLGLGVGSELGLGVGLGVGLGLSTKRQQALRLLDQLDDRINRLEIDTETLYQDMGEYLLPPSSHPHPPM